MVEKIPSSQRMRRRPGGTLLIVGVTLLVAAFFAMNIGGFAVMGDPSPQITRAGVSAGSGGFLLLIAACPGERIRQVILWRHTESGPSIEMWRIRGDASPGEGLLFGSTPPGMETVTPLTERLDNQEPLSISVVTTQSDNPSAMDFVLSDVPSRGVLSSGNVYPTAADFAQAVLAQAHCGDPYENRSGERLAHVALSFGAAAAALGGLFVFLSSRRRRRIG